MTNSEFLIRGASSTITKTCNIGLQLVWHFLHLLAKIWHFVIRTTHTLQSYLISSGLLKKYKTLDMNKLQYLAIVVDSEEAYDTARVIKLMSWMSTIGVKNICLYDIDGVLKKSKKIILEALGEARSWEPHADETCMFLDQKQMTVEFVSYADGKEGTAKAASFLCSKFLKICDISREPDKPIFTEANMSRALSAVGCGGPDPNLLLVYGPVRCHLGFPAWRMRYTEIVQVFFLTTQHMGPLKAMKYGAILKAIHKFTGVQQNFGKCFISYGCLICLEDHGTYGAHNS